MEVYSACYLHIGGTGGELSHVLKLTRLTACRWITHIPLGPGCLQLQREPQRLITCLPKQHFSNNFRGGSLSQCISHAHGSEESHMNWVRITHEPSTPHTADRTPHRSRSKRQGFNANAKEPNGWSKRRRIGQKQVSCAIGIKEGLACGSN